MDNGAVLGNDTIDEVQVTSDPPQFVKNSAGDQQNDAALGPGLRDRVSHRGIEHATLSDGAVIIERDNRHFHRSLLVECST